MPAPTRDHAQAPHQRLDGLGVVFSVLALTCAVSGCGPAPGTTSCNPGDADGVNGGNVTVDVTASDTAFSIGTSGAGGANVTVQNRATVTLNVTNVGRQPHDFVVQCQAYPNAQGCPTSYCFPDAASLPAIAPGQTATTTFVAPALEGLYPFVSDLPGDAPSTPDGGHSGLVGEFNLI